MIKTILSISYFIILTSVSVNIYAQSYPIFRNNTERAIAFLKSQPNIAKDAEITIRPAPGPYNLESCQNIDFSTIENNQKSTNLRFLANCKKPQNWTLFLNATIKKKHNYFITRRHLKRGDVVTRQDLQEKYDSEFSTISNFVTQFDEVNNLAAAHDIKVGTILRNSDLSEQILVTRYEQVKIINTNNGFSVATSGKSLNNATKGHTVRVQLANKRVVSGIAISVGTVEISN